MSAADGGEESVARRAGPLVVGYIMRDSRARSLSRQNLIHLKVIDGLCFVGVDHTTSIGEQQRQRGRKFDVLLHKASDWMAYDAETASATLSLPFVFDSIEDAGIPWLDDLASTKVILRRLDIHALLTRLAGSEGRDLFLPATTALADVGDLRARAPFIVKSNAACGVSFSHKMVIVRNLEDEGEADLAKSLDQCYDKYRDLVVQDLVPHDGSETKVYCIGSVVHMSRRKLAAAETIENDSRPRVTVFDSLETKNENPDQTRYPIGEEDRAELEACARWLRTELGIHLFGFDALRVEGTHRMAIIDVNYFPSFKGIPSARADLHRCFRALEL